MSSTQVYLYLCVTLTLFLSLPPLCLLKSLQRVLLSSLLVSRGKLTVSLWPGDAMGLLSVKTTAMSLIVPCAQSRSSSVPAGSVLTGCSDATEMQTARINRTKRTAKVSKNFKTQL